MLKREEKKNYTSEKMEALLSELQKLSTSNRVIQPEQVILQQLIKFDLLFPQISNETDFRQLEKGLFNLFKINSGNISVQCSISIAFRLTQIYNKLPDPPVASDISDLVNKLTQASTIAIGEIFNRSGSRCASQIPKAINALILLPEELRFHSLFALRGIFKTKAQSLSQFCAPVYKFLRKSIDVIPEANQIIALKLVKAIVQFDKSYFSSAIECCDSCLLKSQTPFVRFQASRLAAYCAFIQSSNSLKESFSIIQKYTSYLSPIISRFLELLPVSTIVQNSNEIFQLIRKISPNDINLILNYLSPSDKQNLFGTVLSEPKPSPSQLSVLNLLIVNESDILSCVSAALQLARSSNPRDIEAASFFFSNLARDYPSVAQNVIQSAIVENTKINSDEITNANSIAVAAVIEKNPSLVESLKQGLDEYVNTISSLTDFGSMRFSALWLILSYVPENFFDPQKLSSPLRGSCEVLLSFSSTNQQSSSSQNQSSSANMNEQKWTKLMEALLRLFAKHSKLPHSDLAYNAAQSNLNRLSEQSLASLIEYIIASRRNADSIITFIIQKMLSSYPGRVFLKKQIKRNVTKGEDLLIPKVDEIETLQQIATQKIINMFPSLMKCCQSVQTDTIITNLVTQSVTSAQMLVGHTILLRIVEDDDLSRSFSKSFIGSILKTLKGSDFFRIQITCELVAKAIERQMAMMDALFKFIEMNKRAVSCLLLSAIMCQFHLSDSLLSRAILFIGERFFSHFSAPFALHSLSTALTTQAETVNKLGIAWQHTNILLKLMHDSTSLHPVIIHLISVSLVDLLPLITTNIDISLKNATVLDILSVIESIRASPYTFAKGVFYFTSSSLSRISYQMSSMIPIEFPMSNTTSYPILLSASEAYSMIGRGTVTQQIPRLLTAIEYSNHPNQLTAVAQLISRENGQFLLSLIQNVLVNESIPLEQNSTKILAPSNKIKYMVLQSLGTIFNTVTINEAPIIAVALCKTAASGILELQTLSFPMLSSLLQRFTFSKLQSQFAALMPIAFKLSFNVSGGFLVSFMNKNNLQLCFESLSKCTNDQQGTSETPEYTMMFTRALKICRESYEKKVPDFVKNYAPIIKPKLESIAKQVIKANDSISSVAINYQSIWTELWQSLVYTDFVIGKKPSFDPKFLLSFFIIQLRKSAIEAWQARGFIYGAASIIQFYPNENELELVKEVIDACITLLPIMNGQQMIEEPISQLFKYTSRYLKDAKTTEKKGEEEEEKEKEDILPVLWNILLFSVLNYKFEAETAARCFEHFDSDILEKHILDLTKSLLTRIALDDNEKCIALFNVLLMKVEEGIDTIIDELIDWSQKTPKSSIFTFRLLTLLIKKKIKISEKDDVILDYDKISEFIMKRLRRGGINFIASLLTLRKEVGIQLAIRGATGAASVLVVNDPQNAGIYIKFLMLCAQKINNEKLINIMLEIAMKSLTNDNLSNDLVKTCVQVFKIEQKEKPEYFKKFWESQDESNRELCVRNIISITS